jgi:Tripartite tricarboxylate transporter TctB family
VASVRSIDTPAEGEWVPADDTRPDDGTPQRPGPIQSPENFVGGLVLLALGGLGFFGTAGVDMGSLAEFGAGMVPRVVSVLVAGFGLGLMALGCTTRGAGLERWSWRGPVCVLGAVVAFGLTLRGFDFGLFRVPALGLVVAGPLAVSLASLADPDTRPQEIAIFAVGLTLLCTLVFRFLLRLPIPVAPWLIGY